MGKKFKGSTPAQREYYNARERLRDLQREFRKQGAVLREDYNEPPSVTYLSRRNITDEEFLARAESIRSSVSRVNESYGNPNLWQIGIGGLVDTDTGEYLEPEQFQRHPFFQKIQQKLIRKHKRKETALAKREEKEERRKERERNKQEKQRQKYKTDNVPPTGIDTVIPTEDVGRFISGIDNLDNIDALVSDDELAEHAESNSESLSDYSDDSPDVYIASYEDIQRLEAVERRVVDDGELLFQKYLTGELTAREFEIAQKNWWFARNYKLYIDRQIELGVQDNTNQEIFNKYKEMFADNWYKDGEYLVHKKTGFRVPMEELIKGKVPTEEEEILRNVFDSLLSKPKNIGNGGVWGDVRDGGDYSLLDDTEEKIRNWTPSPDWSRDLSDLKERDRSTVGNVLKGAIERDGRDKVAQRLKDNASTVEDLIDAILYKTSGGGRGAYDNARDNVEQNFVEFANIVNGRALSLEDNELLTEMYDDMEDFDI